MQIKYLALTHFLIALISMQYYLTPILNLDASILPKQLKGGTDFGAYQFSQLGKDKKQDDFILLTRRNCFIEKKCLAFIYVRKKVFNKKKLIELSNLLNKKNKEKEILTVYFFDDLELGRAHAQGKKEPADLENDAKGLFRHDAKEEYVKIRLAGKISNNWDRWKTIYTKKFQTK